MRSQIKLLRLRGRYLSDPHASASYQSPSLQYNYRTELPGQLLDIRSLP
jgi:hypothetical protein